MKPLAIRPFAQRPRPVRVLDFKETHQSINLLWPAIEAILEPMATMNGLVETLAHHPTLGGMMRQLQQSESGKHHSAMFLFTEILYAKQPHALFEIDPHLVSLLQATDFSAEHPIPMSYCRVPVEGNQPLFLHVPSPPDSLQVESDSDVLPVSGYYLRQVDTPSGKRLLEVVVVSQPPAGNQGMSSDTFIYVDLLVEDEDASLLSLFERQDITTRIVKGLPDDPILRQRLRPHLEFICKLLVYLGIREVRREVHGDKTQAIKAAMALGPRKKTVAINRANKVYDYVRISAPMSTPDADAEDNPGARTVAAHSRRGHFRLARVGEGRAERRLVWVRPTLVGVPGAQNERRYHVF